MGVDYDVYVGTYLTIEFKPKVIPKSTRFCEKHPDRPFYSDEEFCSQCGGQIETAFNDVNQFIGWGNLFFAEMPKDIQDIAWGLYTYSEYGDTSQAILIDSNGKELHFNEEYEIEPDVIANDTLIFISKYQPLIDWLKLNDYCENIDVKYGVVTFCSY